MTTYLRGIHYKPCEEEILRKMISNPIDALIYCDKISFQEKADIISDLCLDIAVYLCGIGEEE